MATTYNVYRDGNKVASKLNNTTYIDDKLDPNTEYKFEVTSENEFGESSKSDPITVKTNYSDVSSVSLNKNSLTLDTDKSETLTETVTPNTAKQSVTWSSSDDTIATVNSNGKVTALKQGSADITVTSDTNSAKSDVCSVTVNSTNSKQ